MPPAPSATCAYMRNFKIVIVFVAVALGVSATLARANVGTPATPAQVRAETSEILPDGTGLPNGRGSVAQGEMLYETRCASCHSVPIAPALSGGIGSLTRIPERTVNSYWPAAPIVFDYIRRAMPPNAPGSLSPDQIYALCAYIFSQDRLVPKNAFVDRKTLPNILLPNRDGFTLLPASTPTDETRHVAP